MQKTCIIIPCYNESERFKSKEFLHYLSTNDIVSFCLVNDGSSDSTIELLINLQKGREERIIICDLPQNSGKAEAIRLGVQESIAWKGFDFIGFFDADFATPLSEIGNFIRVFQEKEDVKFILGARIQRLGSNINRTYKRHYFGRIFATFASIILKLAVYDTQCGAKIMDIDLAKKIFSEKFISKWLFDIELIFRVINLIGKEETQKVLYELPLNQWSEIKGSKIKLSYLFKVPFELLKIKKHYKKIKI